MKSLSGKNALVTGGSRGIGAGIALKLAAEGARVIINYHNDQRAAEDVVSTIVSAGGWAKAFQADIANVSENRALAETAAAEFSNLGGRLNTLVCNAGICMPRPLEQIEESDFDLQFTTNVKAVLFGVQSAAKIFGNDGGTILIIGSINGQYPIPGEAVYSATKAAVASLTVSFAAELGPRGIRINTLAPGLTGTDMVRDIYKAQEVADTVARTPLRRLGRPEDIANVAAFLVSDQSAWITGDVITASGGLCI